jgi:3D-(3,5/4)-trihydroxycyclohexane-1,2-dione acylhydrolase (decyclizing)
MATATLRLTMAQALLRYLAAQYVREEDGAEVAFVRGVFGIFGHGNVNGIGQALEEYGDLDYVQGHNEQGMVHAAVAYARQLRRRRIWACTTSIGPGAMNMVTAAAAATVNRIPVLLLPGDTFASRQPDPVLQQLEDPASRAVSANDALRPVSAYWDRIVRPEQVMSALDTAIDVLTDPVRAGAVTLALPQDVQSEAYDYPERFFERRVHRIDRRPPEEAALDEAAAVLVAARRPLMVVGGGARYSRADEAVDRFARAFGVPVAETQAGKSLLPGDHPLNVGGLGVTGTAAANALAHEADVVLAVGTRLGDFTTASRTAFAPAARLVGVNVVREDAIKLDGVALVADARAALDGLADRLAAAAYRAAYADGEIAALRGAWDAEVDRLFAAERPAGEEGMAQTRVLGELWRALGPDCVIVNAAGSLPGDLHRLWRAKGPDTYHMEYGFSCMGYEIAGAVGVRLAEPAREVLALVGDGSFLMLHSELFTALQQGIKIIVVVFNNGGYQCIRNLQMGHGSAGFGNEFRARSGSRGELDGPYLPIDFAMIARGLGAVGLSARTPAELIDALAKARGVDRAAVIDVAVAPGTETSGYDSWWHVPVAEVSGMASVNTARRALETARTKARP